MCEVLAYFIELFLRVVEFVVLGLEAEAVDEAGALLLRQLDGRVKRVLTGDVTLGSEANSD